MVNRVVIYYCCYNDYIVHLTSRCLMYACCAKVPQHSELCWILSCLTPFQPLQRMTQFKVCLHWQERERDSHRQRVSEWREIVDQCKLVTIIYTYTEQSETRRCCFKGY